MRTETINVYKFNELSEKAKATACEIWRKRTAADPVPWQEETFESLTELIGRLPGVRLKDYELGLYCHSFLKIEFENPDVGELDGARAIAWLENNLLSHLRITWTGSDRKKLREYGYRPGQIPDCPLTGYCADDDFVQALRDNVRRGYSLKQSIEFLSATYTHLLESEHAASQEDEYIGEHLSANDYEFTGEGKFYSWPTSKNS